MALTITKVAGADTVFGNKRVKVRDITFDSSYPTTGESLTAADVGLTKIDFVETQGAKNSAGTAQVPVVYDYTNSKLQIYRYDGASVGKANLEEAAAAFDASAFTARVRFVGH
jgi:hypothetical protein